MRRLGLTVLMLAAAQPVLAHVGHEGAHHAGDAAQVVLSASEALHAGLRHPVTGIDHLLMLLGTGVLSAVTARNLGVPLLTLAAMLLGAVAGGHVGAFFGMEMVIVASLAVSGLALMVPAATRMLVLIMPLLALAHGWAHGVEASPGAFWPFVAGFVLASAALLGMGHGLGRLLGHHRRVRQLAGGGILGFAAIALAA